MNKKLSIFTCSIYPDLTRIWYHCLSNIFTNLDCSIYIYDSSGLLEKQNFPKAKIIKIPNIEHGKKINHFIKKELKTDLMFLIDDDAFFTSELAITYGKKWLNISEKNAIISYKPRPWWNLKVNNVNYTPMGSYALMIKIAPIKKNKLSFASKPTKNKEIRNGTGYYDTGDYINQCLLQQGFQIKIADLPYQEMIPTFFGTSSGFLCFYKKRFWAKKRKKISDESIKNVVLTDTYNLQRAISITFAQDIYNKIFQSPPIYNDFLSIEALEKLVLQSNNKNFIDFYFTSILKHNKIKTKILSL